MMKKSISIVCAETMTNLVGGYVCWGCPERRGNRARNVRELCDVAKTVKNGVVLLWIINF